LRKAHYGSACPWILRLGGRTACFIDSCYRGRATVNNAND
jgi:hypothetical protein